MNFKLVQPEGMPDLPLLMLQTLGALKRLGGSASIQELDEAVIENAGVSEDEQQLTMPNDTRPKLNYFLAWSRTYLRRGDAIKNSSRGVWAITEIGRAIQSVEECRAIYAQVQSEEREKQRVRRKEAEQAKAGEEDTGVNESNDKESSEDWKQALLSTVRSMQPSSFERLSQRVLREAGFTKVEVRGKSGDGGIDGIGVLRVNLVSFQVYFQCKRYSGSVPSKDIRDFRGALQGRADKGLFITTGNFTSQASEEATRDGAIAIDLIDGDRLCDLLQQFELGVRTEKVERVTIDPEWYRLFDES